MNESLGKLSGMKVRLSVDMESGTLTESGMKDLGLNAQEVTQFAAELASISNSMGQTGDVSLATADAFTKLAGDMSSYYNVDYGTVVNDLKNALLGQSDALSKYEVILSDAKLQTYAYTYGLEKSVNEMTEAEKMQLSLIAILGGTEKTWGNLADNINTPANSFRELTNNCKEVVNVFGQLFMPVLDKILPVINGVVIGVRKLLSSLAGIFGIEINMDNMGVETDDIATSVGDYSGTENNHSLGTGESINLADGILAEVARYEEAWNKAYENMDKKSQEFADKVTTFLEPVKSIFSSLAIGDYVSVGENVGLLAISITDFIKNAIDSVDWHAVGEKIGEFIEGINWTEVFSSLGELLWEAISAAIELWNGIFDAAPIEAFIISQIALIKWTGLAKVIMPKGEFKDLGQRLLEGPLKESSFAKVGKLFSNIKDKVVTMGTQIGKVAGAIVGKVVGVISQIAGGISNAISTVGTFIKSIITFLQPFAAAIAGVVAVIAGIALAVTNFITMFQEGFSWVNEEIMLVGIALAAVGAVLMGAPALVAGIVAAIVAVVATIAVVIHENWDAICAFFSSAIEWIYTNIITPLGEMFISLGEGILNILVNAVAFIGAIIGSVFTELFNSFKAIFESLKNIFTGIIEFITGVFSLDWKKAWNGLVNIFSGIFGTIKNVLIMPLNVVIALIETLVNKIIGGWNSLVKALNKFSIDIPSWVPEIGGKKFGINIKTASTITIPRFATGGFPEDGWFRASHGEIMGRFDNGQSVVANNMQITEGIARGVREAVSGVLIPYLADIADSSRRTANKDFTVASRDVFEAVRAESSNYTRRTGELAFI